MQEKYQRVHAFSSIPVQHPALFYDDGNGTWVYTMTGTGTDYTGVYSASYNLVGVKGIQISTKATTPAVDDYVNAEKKLWLPPARLVRVQLNVIPKRGGSHTKFALNVQWYDGSNAHGAYISLHSEDASVYYLNDAGSTVQIPGWSWYVATDAWNHLDLSLDYNSRRYRRVALNHQVTDLNLPVYSSASSLAPHLRFQLQCTNRSAGTAGVSDIDRVLITPEALL